MARPAPKSVTDAIVAIVLVVAGLSVIYKNLHGDRPTTTITLEVPSEPLSLDGAKMRGSNSAEAVMMVFADFQCRFCGRFAREVQPEIERRYVADGRVAVAFRHLPLPNHPQAVAAAVVAECADRQGKFWETHDRLFAEVNLNEETLKAVPASLDLDQQILDECLRDRSVIDQVMASVHHASGLGIMATPAFLFGKRLADGRVQVSRVLSGAKPLHEFLRELDAALDDEGPFWRKWTRGLVSWIAHSPSTV